MTHQSEQINELSTALSKAQAIIESPKKNKQGHGYKYADYGECRRVLKEPFEKFGLAVTHAVIDDKLVTTLSHSSGQWIKSFIPLKEGGGRNTNPMQALGSALTYASRYGLCLLIGIAGEEDDDAQGLSHSNHLSVNEKTAGQKIGDLCKRNMIEIKDFQAFHEIDSTERCLEILGNFDYFAKMYKDAKGE